MTNQVIYDKLLAVRGNNMAQTMVNFRMDAKLKKDMEKACKAMGLTLTAAFTMFATKVAYENRIPFDVEVDPFYSKENMKRLEQMAKDIKEGKIKFVEHDLIEVNDED